MVIKNLQTNYDRMDYIIDNARRIYKEIGAGFDDEVYMAALKIGLQLDEQMLEENCLFDIKYRDFKTGYTLTADLVVNQEVLVMLDDDRDYLRRLVNVSGLKKGIAITFGETDISFYEYTK